MPNDQKDPWGGSPNNDQDDIVKALKKMFSQKSGTTPPKGVAVYLGALLGFLLLVWAISGIFIVSPAEQSVVLRFGQYQSTLGPGPHWIPRFIDSQYTLDVQKVRNFNYSAEMLTKDENIVYVALAVQYRIGNPNDFLFKVASPFQTLQQATSSALRQVVGMMTLDSVLTTGREELRDNVTKQLNTIMQMYSTGLTVLDVRLQPAKPPEAVTEAFDDAIKAREDEQRYINQAKAYARRVNAIVAGKVSRLQQSANAYKEQVVLQAQGSTARYLALLSPYEKAPQVTRDRLYLDAVSNVLSRTTNIVIDSGGSNVLYLPLDQILKRQLSKANLDVTPKENNPAANSDTTTSSLPTPSATYGGNRQGYPTGRGRQ